jgi:hypothetical protein
MVIFFIIQRDHISSATIKISALWKIRRKELGEDTSSENSYPRRQVQGDYNKLDIVSLKERVIPIYFTLFWDNTRNRPIILLAEQAPFCGVIFYA